ncbi:unnamed protein product, partial [Choristocarpus tenellus]
YSYREKDIIILSCVRAPEEGTPAIAGGSGGYGYGAAKSGGIGFLDDWRRLNVAITRAKYGMWIVGNSSTLKQNCEWRELINDSKKKGAFIENDQP